MVEIMQFTREQAIQALTDLSELLRDCVEGGASIGFILPLQTGETDAYWQGIIPDLDKGKRVLLAAYHEGRIVGSVQLELAQKANAKHRAEVQKLLVHRSARRMGIGSQLMYRLEQVARQHHRTLLVLDTAADDGAKALYHKLGFMEAGIIPHFALSPDQTRFDATLYMYRLLD